MKRNTNVVMLLLGFLMTTACSNTDVRKEEKLEQTPELVIVRNINGSRDQVWKAWTEPNKIKKWWGPKNYTAPVIKNDLRTGGQFHFAMKDPEGKLYWSTGTYKQIEPYKKIVSTDSFSNAKGEIVSSTTYGLPEMPKELLMTTLFEEEKGQTKLTIRVAGLPPGEVVQMTESGWNESLDKLQAVVQKK